MSTRIVSRIIPRRSSVSSRRRLPVPSFSSVAAVPSSFLGMRRRRPTTDAFSTTRSMHHHQHQAQQHRFIFSFFAPNQSDADRSATSSSSSPNEASPHLSMPPRQQQGSLGHDRQKQLQRQQKLQESMRLHQMEVQELVKAPVGSYRPSTWQKAERLLEVLMESEGHDYQAFLLLESMSREPDARVRLTNETVYGVVLRWLHHFNVQQKNSSQTSGDPVLNTTRGGSDSTAIVSPSFVWKKIQAFERRGIQLEAVTYHRLIEATQRIHPTNLDNKNGPELAEEILEWMMKYSKASNPLIRPSTYTFFATLTSWENAASQSPIYSKEAPTRALALLQKIKTMYQSGWGPEVMPDKNCYRKVMNMYAHQGDGDQVEALLEELYTLYLDEVDKNRHRQTRLDLSLCPTTPFFSLVLYAWSKSDDPMAAERSEAILNRMLEMEESGDIPNFCVPANCFNIVMIAWARTRAPESALKVQSLFDRMVQLSEKEHDGAEQYQQSDKPELNWSKKPIGGSYVALLTTWSRYDAQKAEDVYREWKHQHELGNVEMRVDADLIRTLVQAVYTSNAPDRAERCERWIQAAMQHDSEDSPCVLPAGVVNTAINAWCQTKTMEGAERAEALLRQLHIHHESTFPPSKDTAPTIYSYLPIAQAFATLGQVDRAEELVMEWMLLDPSQKQRLKNRLTRRDREGKFYGSSKSDDHLETRIFNICLKAWSSKTTTAPEAAARAENLLLSMKNLGTHPNAASFKYVLDAWRDTKRQKPRGWSMGYIHNQNSPKVAEVVALMDMEHKRGGLGATNESYLSLRQGWLLLELE